MPKKNPRQTAAFLTEATYAIERGGLPRGHGYLFRSAPVPASANRSINRSPFALFIAPYRTSEGDLYVIERELPPNQARTPLPDRDALPTYLAPLGPYAVTLPNPTHLFDETAETIHRRRVRQEIADANDGDELTGITTATVSYYRKATGATLTVRGGKVYKGEPDLQRGGAWSVRDRVQEEYPFHVYLRRNTLRKNTPLKFRNAIPARVMFDTAKTDREVYVRMTKAEVNDPEIRKFIRTYATLIAVHPDERYRDTALDLYRYGQVEAYEPYRVYFQEPDHKPDQHPSTYNYVQAAP